MTDSVTTAVKMESSLKDSGIIVDMTPAALMQHNSLAPTMTLHTLKDSSSPDRQGGDVMPLAVSNLSPTNLSTSPPMTTFRCERCDNFETNSRPSLLLHVVQCLASTARLKVDEPDVENLSIGPGGIDHSNAGKMPTDTSNAASPSSSSSSSRKVFECDVCNMKFSNGANMRRHKMRHTGVKPYECRVCQKRFFRKDHLAEHFTTHTKTLPYHCPICNRGFQRQIAMRAHFQNEHVGQHDLVKTCPLCSYRAGSMKSLRIHFFNRHGIDLDNPGPGGTSSLLLALESQASQVTVAATVPGFVPGLSATAVNSNTMPSHQSDSGESLRSNPTPPMHFLTPHVEISTLSENGTELFNGQPASSATGNDPVESKSNDRDVMCDVESPTPPRQNRSMEYNAKSMPSSTSSVGAQLSASPKSHHHDNHITPSISLIPIKQEPIANDELCSESNKGAHKMTTPSEQNNRSEGNELEFSSPNNRLTSLIKVSPLKSLLREDLKRRICAKASNRITRNAAALENNNVIQAVSVPNSSSCNATPICNGTITSTGQETEASLLNRKQVLTCLFCGIEFPDETLYFLHKGCHCESNPWKCNICGEQCNNVYEFNSHLLSKSHQ